MNLTVKHEIVKDAQDRVLFRTFQSGGREHYNIRLWLDGPADELDQIEKVTYTLHPSFRRQNRTSSKREGNFAISIWTWGMFNIRIQVELKNGEHEDLQYYLSYELPPDREKNYRAA